jgi:hypothetical protein
MRLRAGRAGAGDAHGFEKECEGFGLRDRVVVEDPNVREIREIAEGDLFAFAQAAAATEIRSGGVVAMRDLRIRDEGRGFGIGRIIHHHDAVQGRGAPIERSEEAA